LFWDCSSPGKLGNSGGAGESSGGGSGGTVAPLTIDPTASQGGASGTGVDSGSGAATGSTGNAEGTCGGTTITPNRAPADILIVLDRSGSMLYSIADDCYCPGGAGAGNQVCRNATNCTDRWSAVKSAVSQTMSANTSINWGLEFFSSPTGDGECSVSLTPQVAIGAADAAATIQANIAGDAPGGHTPTALAINLATLYMQSVNDPNSKAILLATDGEPNCSGGKVNETDDMPATTLAVGAAAGIGIPVYVIGMGPATSIANLNDLAVAGGTGSYYPATSPQQLSDALAKITKIVATSCTFQTPQTPPDPTRVYVYVDGQQISQDPAEGWDFGADSSTFVLTGSYCTDMLNGVPMDVKIIFGCLDYTPPTTIY
jgi:Mg-chelatase subunit ChlD